MKKGLKILVGIFLFVVLTVTTQIGGVIFLISILANKLIPTPKRGKASQWALFIALYFLGTFILVPPMAKAFGRVPLPISKKGKLIPNQAWTYLLNRHYVKPKLYRLVTKSAEQFAADELRQIRYLDANFPFVDGFPLLPHRSHDDGEKIDLAFLYIDKATEKPWTKSVSFFGYGFCEGPKQREENMPALCAKRGYWQYSLLDNIIGKVQSEKVRFDAEATRRLIKNLSAHPHTKKIFIEPHLKQRLGFSHDDKVRFHGCAAVRHDDHIHLEM